jgi:Tol biopolymer transport system component
MKKSVIIGIAVGIIILGIGGYFYWQAQKGEIIEPADITQVTFLSTDGGDQTWSSDSSQIAFVDYGVNEIAIITVGETELRYLGIGGTPCWNPVENKLAVSGGEEENLPGSGIHIVDIDTMEITFLAEGELQSWNHDGTKIVYALLEEEDEVESSSIWMMNADGSGKTHLTTDEDGFCTGPSFSYDGSKIVYIKGLTDYGPMGESRYGSNEIWVMNSDGLNKHQIYAPDGISSLIFMGAWNKDNKILFMYRGVRWAPMPSVWVINSDGSNPHPIAQNPKYVYGDPVYSKDGTQIAVSKIDNRDVGNIYIFSSEE